MSVSMNLGTLKWAAFSGRIRGRAKLPQSICRPAPICLPPCRSAAVPLNTCSLPVVVVTSYAFLTIECPNL